MRYFIRINEDPEIQAEAKHVEKISDTEIEVRDVAAFPNRSGSVKVSKFELVDEEGTVWAFRRLPASARLLLTAAFSLTVDWRMTVTAEGAGLQFGAQG